MYPLKKGGRGGGLRKDERREIEKKKEGNMNEEIKMKKEKLEGF